MDINQSGKDYIRNVEEISGEPIELWTHKEKGGVYHVQGVAKMKCHGDEGWKQVFVYLDLNSSKDGPDGVYVTDAKRWVRRFKKIERPITVENQD